MQSTVSTTPVSFRIPVPVKQAAQKVAEKTNMSLTCVVTQLLKGYVANPSMVLTENGFTPAFEQEILSGAKSKRHSFKSGNELVKSLQKRTKKS